MSRKRLVFDSTAIIALIKGETGAQMVRLAMALPYDGLYIHTINVCEVAYHMIRLGFLDSLACRLATPRGISVVEDVNSEIWKRAANLKARYKNLALGDCIVIALAESLDADVLTGDRGFLEVETHIGITMFR